MRLMVVMASRSKSCQKSEEPQKLDKSAKTIGLEEPSFLTSNYRLVFIRMSFNSTHNGELSAIIKPFKNSESNQLQTWSSCPH